MIRACPRLMLAAPASGVGKTTLTVALLRALADRGMRPAAFKCGPDYIDPMFHREILGVSGGNLDLFLTSPETVRGLFALRSEGAGISVIESAMGFYDGVGGSDRASGWHLASETATPAVLIVRPKGAFLSVAALVDGFLRFRRDSMIRGVVFNQVGEGYCAKLAPVLERETGVRVYGFLPEMPEVRMESRHLGLVTPDAAGALREKIGVLARRMEETIDVPGLVALAQTAPPLSGSLPAVRPAAKTPVRIAVARDAAFCFYYPENLDLLRRFGAELVFFSPMDDGGLPEKIGGLYLGGGYPELFAERLAANSGMLGSVRSAVRSGLPTLVECGGFLYLLSGLADAEGVERRMAGALDGVGRNAGGLRRFGYALLRAKHDGLLCKQGEEIPVHEFHYWDVENAGDSFSAAKPSGGPEWSCGFLNESLFAGFSHLYFWSNPELAGRFVAAAAQRREQCTRN